MTKQLIKERPILFSGAMVRALLAKLKTQTRRVIKGDHAVIRSSPFVPSGYETDHGYEVKCPYGQPGERLYVRETFNTDGDYWYYRADYNDGNPRSIQESAQMPPDWKPSIHMPRIASRLLLEIVAVRVERLKDISEADAKAEGYGGFQDFYKLLCEEDQIACDLMEEDVDDYAQRKGINYPLDWYKMLWGSINGPDSWAANPWVWVVEFKIVNDGKEAARG